MALGTADVSLAIGTPLPSSAEAVFIGSDGWDASISPISAPVVGDKVNPVGAYTAACLGAAEIWKRLLIRHRYLFEGTPVIPLDEPLTFSTFTYQSRSAEPNPALPDTLDLGHLTMVGLGAGGGATVFTLASTGGLLARSIS